MSRSHYITSVRPTFACLSPNPTRACITKMRPFQCQEFKSSTIAAIFYQCSSKKQTPDKHDHRFLSRFFCKLISALKWFRLELVTHFATYMTSVEPVRSMPSRRQFQHKGRHISAATSLYGVKRYRNGRPERVSVTVG